MQKILNSKKTCIATALLLGMSTAALAVDSPLVTSATASTIIQIQLVEVTEMSFGTQVPAAAGTSCTLLGDAPFETVINAAVDGATYTNGTGSGTFNTLGGDCASFSAGGSQLAGVYKVTGDPGASYSISVTAGTPDDPLDDYTFAPGFGCSVSYNNAGLTAADATDTCNFLTTTGTNITLPDATDVTSYTAAAAATTLEAGVAHFTLGGTLTVVTALVSETAYTATFDIVVAYE